MKETLATLYQRRMDRCQSEQIWAIAAYAGINTIVISESEKFQSSFEPCNVVWVLGIIGFLTFLFVIERLHGYYNYRNDLAKLLKDEEFADEHIKDVRPKKNFNSFIWVIVFIGSIVIPFVAASKIIGTTHNPNQLIESKSSAPLPENQPKAPPVE